MTEKLIAILMPIKEQTGLDIDIYTTGGERIAGTDDTGERLLKALPEFGDATVVQDRVTDTTAFRLSIMGKTYIGAIAGAGEVSRNYAALASGLIENAMENLGKTLDRASELRIMLEGDYTRLQYDRFVAKYPSLPDFFVLVFFAGNRTAALRDYLRDLCTENDVVIQTDRTSLVMLKDAFDLDEYQSAADFAHQVCENVEQDIGVHPSVGVGEIARSAEALHQSYRQALDAIRLGRLLGDNNQVFYVKDYLFTALFEELPRERLEDTLRHGVDENVRAIFEDKEMMDTAEQFMLGSLNISETARVMFMHRNTLIYRLDKIEKATGLNIRRFSDAMTFRLLSILYKLISREKD